MIGDAHRELMRADERAFVELITKTAREVEREMRDQKESSMGKYWMVHRPGWPGNPGGPPTVKHATFEEAAKEAERLTRKELARFIVLESVMSFAPYEPISISIKRIGMGPSSEQDCCDPEPRRPDYCRASDEHGEVVCLDPECACAGLAGHETFQDLQEELEACSAVEGGDVTFRCSCFWCDPDNHDDVLDPLPPHPLEHLIPKADCPCGCDSTVEPGIPEVEGYRAEYPSPLGEGEAELRREWMPKSQADLSSSFAGWSIEDFERSLATNLQSRSDLCAGLLRLREALYERASDCTCRPAPHDCDWQSFGDPHWCPHCGYDTRVERPCDCERLHPDIKCPHGN